MGRCIPDQVGNDKMMRLPRLHGFAVNGLAMTEKKKGEG
jgi:hypothetical protein